MTISHYLTLSGAPLAAGNFSKLQAFFRRPEVTSTALGVAFSLAANHVTGGGLTLLSGALGAAVPLLGGLGPIWSAVSTDRLTERVMSNTSFGLKTIAIDTKPEGTDWENKPIWTGESAIMNICENIRKGIGGVFWAGALGYVAYSFTAPFLTTGLMPTANPWGAAVTAASLFAGNIGGSFAAAHRLNKLRKNVWEVIGVSKDFDKPTRGKRIRDRSFVCAVPQEVPTL